MLPRVLLELETLVLVMLDIGDEYTGLVEVLAAFSQAVLLSIVCEDFVLSWQRYWQDLHTYEVLSFSTA